VKIFVYVAGIIVGLGLQPAWASKPKYGPEGNPRAVPISKQNSYFRNSAAKAPDFYNLIGFYVPQVNGYSCSAASVSMVVNAARTQLPQTSDDTVVTQQSLLDKVSINGWKERLSEKGYNGKHGTELEVLGPIVLESLKMHGFPLAQVEVKHADLTKKFRKDIVKLLTSNEASSKDFLIVNFNQQVYTDDAEAGHIGVVGAYDATNAQVLILDPDRDYYEPYWISVDTFIKGMATLDKGSKKTRGYVYVKTGS